MTVKSVTRGNCSTVIVGKNATFNGHVLMAHSEDTFDVRIQSHYVPRKTHGADEYIKFDDGTAVIPQVPVTYAYLWSEVRVPGGECFADTFLNENGVAVASDAATGTSTVDTEADGGIGYGLRKLIAERATSARNGVEIVAELMKEFGYYSSRIYHIADKDEAWSVQVTRGHEFAAQRIGDDEVYYMPNWYTIHQIDFNDTEHKKFYWSENVVQFAIDHGWYTPAKEGDYSDFDFAAMYQGGPAYTLFNKDRHAIGWKKATGKEVPELTFSIKADKKYTIDDLKDIIRTSYLEMHPEDADQHYDPELEYYYTHKGICWHGSIEGSVFEFNEDPMLNCMWRTVDRQRHSVFMPWYFGIKEVPEGFEYMGEIASTASHFFVDDAELRKYNKNDVFWSFHILRNLMDFGFGEEKLFAAVKELEDYFHASKAQIDKAYAEMKLTNEVQARELLNDYTAAMARKTVKFVEQMIVDVLQDKYREKDFYNF